MRVACPVTEREYAPEELVASVLRKLVDDASTYLGEPVEAAVITVLAYFVMPSAKPPVMRSIGGHSG